MSFAEEASRANKFPIFWTADDRNKLFLDLERYLRKLALRVLGTPLGILRNTRTLVLCQLSHRDTVHNELSIHTIFHESYYF
jgi:hypothetical protein